MASAGDVKAGGAFVELTIHDQALKNGLKKAAEDLQHFGESISKVGLGLMAVGGGAVAGLVASAKSAADGAFQYTLLSQRTGLSVEALSKLKYGAAMTGSSLEGAETAIKHMQKTIYEFSNGSKQAAIAFSQLGINVAELKVQSPEQQLAAIGKALAGIPDPAMRTAIAMEILGREGQQIIPLAMNMDQLGNEARDLGAVMSLTTAQALTEFHHELERMETAIGGVVRALGTAVMPVLRGVAESATKASVSLRDFIKNNPGVAQMGMSIGEIGAAAGGTLVGLGMAAKAVSWLWTTIKGGAGVIGSAVAGLKNLVTVAGSLLTALSAPVIAVAALAAGLVAWGISIQNETESLREYTREIDAQTEAMRRLHEAHLEEANTPPPPNYELQELHQKWSAHEIEQGDTAREEDRRAAIQTTAKTDINAAITQARDAEKSAKKESAEADTGEYDLEKELAAQNELTDEDKRDLEIAQQQSDAAWHRYRAAVSLREQLEEELSARKEALETEKQSYDLSQKETDERTRRGFLGSIEGAQLELMKVHGDQGGAQRLYQEDSGKLRESLAALQSSRTAVQNAFSAFQSDPSKANERALKVAQSDEAARQRAADFYRSQVERVASDLANNRFQLRRESAGTWSGRAAAGMGVGAQTESARAARAAEKSADYLRELVALYRESGFG